MNTQLIWELIGYFASALVLVSLLMTSIKKLRVINAIGSLIFSIYAIVIHSYPTAIMNGILVIVNIYYLVKLMRTEVSFSFIEVNAEDAMVKHFLQKYEKDIHSFFPDYNLQKVNKAFAVYQDSTFAGITLGNDLGDGSLELIVDYSAPQYRDHAVGNFMYSQLAKYNYKKLIYSGNEPKHTEYLLKMEFKMENGNYIKLI